MRDSRSDGNMLQVVHLYKRYEKAPLLRDVSLRVDAGEIVCLLGPSGSGKTTLLRIIAGLEQADGGSVLFDDLDLANVPVYRRGFGLMFQDLALFPHRSVFENIAFGLRMQNRPESEVGARVGETLELVGLAPQLFASRDVNRLSGGEQQRVALARSLAPRPRFLMFDEPLGALDRMLREQLVADLRRLLKQIGMTALYVTHDQEEAFAIADRLAILHAGSVQQSGTPQQVYARPANAFVARFLGLTNLIGARSVESHDGRLVADTDIGRMEFPGTGEVGRAGFVLIRPQALASIEPDTTSLATNSIRGTIVERLQVDGHSRILLTSGEQRLSLEWDGPASIGARATFELRADQMSYLET